MPRGGRTGTKTSTADYDARSSSINIDKVSNKEIQDIIMTTNHAQNACASRPLFTILEELGKDMQNPVCIALLHSAPNPGSPDFAQTPLPTKNKQRSCHGPNVASSRACFSA